MLLLSVHRCASRPGQLLAIPKVARETLQWKILGNLRVPRFLLQTRDGHHLSRFTRSSPTPTPTLCPHFLCLSLPHMRARAPSSKEGGLSKFSSDREVGGRSATKNPKHPVRERENRVKLWSSDLPPAPMTACIYRRSCLTEKCEPRPRKPRRGNYLHFLLTLDGVCILRLKGKRCFLTLKLFQPPLNVAASLLC